jgi:hypothetical protein
MLQMKNGLIQMENKAELFAVDNVNRILNIINVVDLAICDMKSRSRQFA